MERVPDGRAEGGEVDRQLVESAPRGDKAAFVDLVRSRVDRLFALAHRILRDVDRPEDALQDALPAFGKFDERNRGPTTRLLQESVSGSGCWTKRIETSSLLSGRPVPKRLTPTSRRRSRSSRGSSSTRAPRTARSLLLGPSARSRAQPRSQITNAVAKLCGQRAVVRPIVQLQRARRPSLVDASSTS